MAIRRFIYIYIREKKITENENIDFPPNMSILQTVASLYVGVVSKTMLDEWQTV